MISASILSIKYDIKKNVEKLSKMNISYIHLDIMDGKFVEEKTWNIDEMKDIVSNIETKLDVHLMVNDVKKYVDDFKLLNPEFITFHYEVSNTLELINYIKSFGIKVGIAINPITDVKKIEEFLPFIDLILVMSVNPGYGGQEFIMTTIDKINYLNSFKDKYNFLIEVDGGINDTNIKLINSDINVVGSYITNSNNYEERINALKK